MCIRDRIGGFRRDFSRMARDCGPDGLLFAGGGFAAGGIQLSFELSLSLIHIYPGIPGGSKAMMWRKLGLCGTPFFRFVESVVVGKIKQLR